MNKPAVRAIVTAALLAAITPALAQVRQIQLGNPMDANPGVNSGGTNAPIPGFVPINGNDIMTGNVSGLSYFHGSTVPNPYQFQGNLPSANLNNFARESAPLQPNGAARPYYLPSSSVSTGQGSIYSAPIGGGFDSRIVPSRAFSPIATPQQLSSVPGSFNGVAYDRQPPQTVPLDATAQGGLLNNPLFMLRTTEEMARQADQARAQAAVQATTQPASVTTQPAESDLLLNGVQGNVGGRVTGQSAEVAAAQGGALPLDERVGSVYASLAIELKKAEGAEGANPGSNQLVATTAIDPLTGRPRLTAASATAPAGAGTAGPVAGGPGAGGAATQPSQIGAHGGDISAKPLEGVSSAKLSAGSNVKPLQMAAPTSQGLVPTAFDVLMVRAQMEMKDGKYVDAQLAYQTALANKPDDPLALVGLANAELASGAYTSAAYDLKFAFTRKPEMAAVRYSADSFIPAARQDYLLDDLLKQTAGKDAANMASFLYCYVCYQTGRKTELQAELKKWNDRPDHDSWAAVATRAWTK